MDVRDIRYFLKVAELGHLGRAAKDLNVSQPALSKCISRLEQSYGVELFERAGRGILLTESGRLLQERFEDIEQGLLEIQREIASLGSGIAGVVRIGCAASIASFFLPRVCRTMQSNAPDLRLQVRVAMDDVLLNELRAGILDVTISPHRSGQPDDAVTSKRLFADTVVVVARDQHPLGRRASLEEMAKYGWVLPAPSVSIRRWLDQAFLESGLKAPEVIVTATPLVAAPAILIETDLLSFMSRQNVQDGKIVEIANRSTTLDRFFDVTHRAHGFVSPAVRYFIGLMEREAARNSRSDSDHLESTDAGRRSKPKRL